MLGAARQALPGRRLSVMTTAGALIGLEAARASPLECAAANWMATAMLVARSLPDAILVDCGGTTTDVIPIAAGAVAARGRTDLERLLEGELVYTGALRTNIAAVVSDVPIGGRPCPVSSELFAITADAHLLRGSLTAEQCTCTFPDNRGTSLARGTRPAGARRVRRPRAARRRRSGGDCRRRRAGAGRPDRRGAGACRFPAARRRARGRGRRGRVPGPLGGGALRPGGASEYLAGKSGEVAAAVALSVLGRE